MIYIKKYKKYLIFVLSFFFLFKFKNKVLINKEFTENDAKEGLLKLSKINYNNAKIIERIYRWETAHFKSKQFKLTGSAGMEVGKWFNLPKNMKSIQMLENGTNLKKSFLVWDNTYDFVKYLSDYIDRYNGNWARWYSTDITKQDYYRNKVNTIKNRFII